ncbi:hypothetical protein GWI33_007643 [Rhynchophorus ferrugineus]|uniref:Uncharacterized protein n=1 Tax=Rhynchophorus ferrugineus TaxID=354439 RepID=A0A834IE25_RHYFE|nr:hypothetical protein GWI33_007643 [Rhynchophorus ferrugineus]
MISERFEKTRRARDDRYSATWTRRNATTKADSSKPAPRWVAAPSRPMGPAAAATADGKSEGDGGDEEDDAPAPLSKGKNDLKHFLIGRRPNDLIFDETAVSVRDGEF